jgi:hypothetical protein
MLKVADQGKKKKSGIRETIELLAWLGTTTLQQEEIY